MTPKSHHYNPQVYLRQFVNPHSGKPLWEYDLRTGTVRKSKPKLSGCEDYYHSFEWENGGRDDSSLEQFFQGIENKLPELFEAIRNRRPITPNIWNTFFAFATLQRARSPKAVRSFQKSLSEVFGRVFELWKSSTAADEVMVQHGLDPAEVRRADIEIAATHGHTVLLTLSALETGSLVKLFAEMNWVFLIAPSRNFFFTSDDPVCCWAPREVRGPFGAVGPAHSQVEVTFPLSRRVCAFGRWTPTPAEQYVSFPVEGVDSLNLRTTMNGWNFIYGPTNDSSILTWVERITKARSESSTPTEQSTS